MQLTKNKNYYIDLVDNIKRGYYNQNINDDGDNNKLIITIDEIKENKWVKIGGFAAISLLGIFLLGKVFKIFSSTVDGYNMLKKSIKNQPFHE